MVLALTRIDPLLCQHWCNPDSLPPYSPPINESNFHIKPAKNCLGVVPQIILNEWERYVFQNPTRLGHCEDSSWITLTLCNTDPLLLVGRYAAAPSRQPQPCFRPGIFEQKRAIVFQSLSENSKKLHSKNPDDNEYANMIFTRSLHTFKEIL